MIGSTKCLVSLRSWGAPFAGIQILVQNLNGASELIY